MSIASLNVCASLKFILILNPHTVLVKGEAFGGDYHEGFSFKNVGDALRKGASVCVWGVTLSFACSVSLFEYTAFLPSRGSKNKVPSWKEEPGPGQTLSLPVP